MTPTPEQIAAIEAELRAGPLACTEFSDPEFACSERNGYCDNCDQRPRLARWVAEREAGLRAELFNVATERDLAIADAGSARDTANRLHEERDHYREEELPQLRAQVAELERDLAKANSIIRQTPTMSMAQQFEAEKRRADDLERDNERLANIMRRRP